MPSWVEQRAPFLPAAMGWKLAAVTTLALVGVPVASLMFIAAQGSGELWPHLLFTVFPNTLRETLILLLGVAVLVVTIGTGLAWLLVAYDFPGRRIFDWALLLPLAVPTYIMAYAYLEILHPIGPVQSSLRWVFGISNPRELWFPEIRSLGGCILLFSFILYPYVLLPTRAMFLMQGANQIEVARMLGASRSRVFFTVALPLARPAIAIGTSLALMEALNDVGASEFLGVQTMSVAVYSTWINHSNLAGAAQIALMLLSVIVLVVAIERWARRKQRFASAGHRMKRATPQRLTGWQAAVAITAASLPVLFGFVLPASHLANEAMKRISFAGVSWRIGQEILNTVLIASLATCTALALGLVLCYAARVWRRPEGNALVPLASIGYAIPGTVLAIGLLAPLAALDGTLANVLKHLLGANTGLLLFGSGLALIYAYTIRFLAISAGGLEGGFGRISTSLDDAARSLGKSRLETLARVHLPLIRPAAGMAALLVFVDCMKELPATLLLRPLNFETLATHIYGEAIRGTYEEGAVAALCIVFVGLLPVVLLARASRRPALAHKVTGTPTPLVPLDDAPPEEIAFAEPKGRAGRPT